MAPTHDQSGLKIDLGRRRILSAGKEIRLTRIQFDILAHLAEQPGDPVSSRLLMQRIWGPAHHDSQTLRVHIAQLRRKIEPDPSSPTFILSEHGFGYRLAGEVKRFGANGPIRQFDATAEDLTKHR